MIQTKTPQEIELMSKSGQIASEALREVLRRIDVGVKTIDLEKIADDYILSKGATASFKTVDGYSFATCINVNDGIVHGIPSNYEIKKGDLVSVDLGALLNDYHSDISYTVEVGTKKETDFLELGKRALNSAIEKCVVGNTVGDISYQMQRPVEEMGFSVSRELVGHGIGRNLHEDPYVPCYGKPGKGPVLKEGMALAIEIIYQKGKPELFVEADDWTLSTADRSLSALFEKTVAVTKNGPKLLTDFI